MSAAKYNPLGHGTQKERPSNRRVTRRAAIVLGLQLALGGALAWRMRQLQVVETDRYRLLAEENRINMRLIAPARAQIFDRNGKPLAVNTKNYRVVMIREQTGDVDATLDDLGQLIEIPERQRRRVTKELNSKSAFVPVSVAEHLSWDEFSRINVNAPALPGIQPEVGLSRHYPFGTLTAHVVGYVGRVTKRDLEKLETVDPVLQIPEFQIGKSGIEKAAESDLRGEAGSRQIEVNALGRVIRELDRIEGLTGNDLHLTLDLDLQDAVLRRLNDESAAAVLMDLRDGDLLALASSPTYDPNPFVLGISQNEYSALLENDHRPLHNKWASGMYPPGSTFKMVVALAALEAGVVNPGESVFCPGFMKLGRRKFHCWRRGGHGHLNLEHALEQSCDVYFYEIARRTGIDNIAAMARKLSIGTDIDLPVSAMRSGLMPTKAWKSQVKEVSWQVGDTLNAGIGQGFVLATPLQLAVMTARIATGRGIAPRLIRAIDGQPQPIAEDQDLGIDPYHLQLVRKGMFDVVNSRRGTARRSRISDEENAMAGKTGTSQVRNITAAERARGVFKNKDLPWRRRDHALFVAFAPYKNPRYAVSVIVEHGGGGSKAAAPIARDIMLRALYGPEPPDRAYPSGKAPKRTPGADPAGSRIPT